MNKISYFPQTGFYLDFLRTDCDFSKISDSLVEKALGELKSLESGEKVNFTENRMVGHYWLRNSELAPNEEIKNYIGKHIQQVKNFSESILKEGKFKKVLIAGIGGSALGPQFLLNALGQGDLKFYFIDNTDPIGIDRTLNEIGDLEDLLVIVITKSGSTPETANAMLAVQNAFGEKKYNKNFVAITLEDSKLDKLAKSEGWLEIFYLQDWIGGRTSIWSAVGLLPMALAKIDIDLFIKGAADMDQATRQEENNPALMLCKFAYEQAGKNMVILPYSDSLSLLGKYLQQLVMESLGKKKTLKVR